MENMNWDVREEGSWVILSISGRLDRMNADETGRQGESCWQRIVNWRLTLQGWNTFQVLACVQCSD